jgi:hypothetical protein
MTVLLIAGIAVALFVVWRVRKSRRRIGSKHTPMHMEPVVYRDPARRMARTRR